jgi:hypothetical protein
MYALSLRQLFDLGIVPVYAAAVGVQAANGEIYDMETLVAAHRTLPFNTWVRVVNLRNGKFRERGSQFWRRERVARSIGKPCAGKRKGRGCPRRIFPVSRPHPSGLHTSAPTP